MKVRIQFAKHGTMKYIGHLDMMRYFQKAIRRADIPIKYSTGFSPHQIMSFAQPLGVGMESEGEYFDIETEKDIVPDEVMNALNQTMVEGVAIRSVVILPDNAMNAMASIAASSYKVEWKNEKKPSFDLNENVSKLNAMEQIPYTKQTKKNVLEIDVKPGIFDLHVEEDILYMTVDASSSGNIKPTIVLDLLYKLSNQELPEYAWLITKLETYTRNENGDLIALREVGTV